jgi:hypothetical protein
MHKIFMVWMTAIAYYPVMFQQSCRNWIIAPLDDGYMLGGIK